MDYLSAMMKEMADWMTHENCRIDLKGDDQSIHNHLFYSNQLKNAKAIPHRTGAIHVVGYEAARIFEVAQREAEEKGSDSTHNMYVRENKWHNWLPDHPVQTVGETGSNEIFNDNLINRDTGMIVNYDGSPSAQVHQYDRFSPLQDGWFERMQKYDWPYNKAATQK